MNIRDARSVSAVGAVVVVATTLALAAGVGCSPSLATPTVASTVTPDPNWMPAVVAGTPVRLTEMKAGGRNPAWSPDGTRIAFVCEHSRSYTRRGDPLNIPISPYIIIHRNICVMNADGSGSVQVTEDNSEDYAPTWSPDGSRIAFTSYRSPQGVIYTINGDGSGLWRITLDEYSNVQPAWSPGGSLIAFSSLRDGDLDIYVVNTDRSGLTQVTDTSYRDETEPDWSPDGTQIAFASGSDEGSGIFVVNLDGTGERLVYASPGKPRSPAWSPDGHRITFASDVGVDGAENLEIFVVNVDGTGLTRLTNRPNRDSDPAWSPDGRKIVFTSDLVGNSEIYVMEVEP